MNGTLMLQYTLSDDSEMEMETFTSLLQSLHRVVEISNDCLSNEVTASITFMRDPDGELFDIVHFSDAGGFEFFLENEEQLNA